MLVEDSLAVLEFTDDLDRADLTAGDAGVTRVLRHTQFALHPSRLRTGDVTGHALDFGVVEAVDHDLVVGPEQAKMRADRAGGAAFVATEDPPSEEHNNQENPAAENNSDPFQHEFYSFSESCLLSICPRIVTVNRLPRKRDPSCDRRVLTWIRSTGLQPLLLLFVPFLLFFLFSFTLTLRLLLLVLLLRLRLLLHTRVLLLGLRLLFALHGRLLLLRLLFALHGRLLPFRGRRFSWSWFMCFGAG